VDVLGGWTISGPGREEVMGGWTISGPGREEVKGGWRKLQNVELPNLYFIVSSYYWMRWAGYLAGIGEVKNVYRILFGKPAGYRPLERFRRRWQDNIKMCVTEIIY
jgi:hypothetical protein